MNEVLNYIRANKERYLNELMDFLRIPSISSLNENKEDVLRAANWLADNIKASGLSNVTIYPTDGHPIVYAENLEAGVNAPTVLFYGHYDVQPVDPLDLWETSPFEPFIKNGKIVGRGTSDDKGQLFLHVKAVEAYMKTIGKLPINIKFIFEGEEEAGSNHLDGFIESHTELLKCDTVMVSDTEWFAPGLPSICYSLRGLSYIEVKITGPIRDLHSGTYGGGVDNPIHVLCDIIARLKDKYGHVAVPGFYDNVLDLTIEERNGFKELPFDLHEYCKDLEIGDVYGENGYTTLERVWARPTLELNGIFGGYTGEGAKTVLPSHASAKISMRLVPHQTHEEITAKVSNYIKELAPPTVKVEVHALHGGNPILVPRDSQGVKAAIASLKEAFGVEPVFMREGGSIPIVATFDSALHAPTVLMGMGLPSDNIHSPNENYELANFYGGIEASAIFIEKFSKM